MVSRRAGFVLAGLLGAMGVAAIIGLVLTPLVMPQSRFVALPGGTTLSPGLRVSRAVRLTGGPHETFGAPTVAVRYSGARDWDRLVAQVMNIGDYDDVQALAQCVGDDYLRDVVRNAENGMFKARSCAYRH